MVFMGNFLKYQDQSETFEYEEPVNVFFGKWILERQLYTLCQMEHLVDHH